MTSPPPTGDQSDVADLVESRTEAADAWMQGDVDRYLALTHHAAGFTLTPPTGGSPRQFADRDSDLEGWRSPFGGGEATVELLAAHACGETAVLVMIERQHGRVAELPDQDWSLRVTEVYRRTRTGWELVHRHADPLTGPITIAQLGELKRGDGSPPTVG